MIKTLYNKAKKNESLSVKEALSILRTPDDQLEGLLTYANQLKLDQVGREVLLCGIVNAKSGKCSEDCSFCAQSAHHTTKAEVYPLLSKEKIVNASEQAKESGVSCFSIVTAGRGVSPGDDFETILEAVGEMEGLNTCTSLGILDESQFKELKAAGLDKYHHNLETAESFFSAMCTTHSYQERVDAIKLAKKEGLKVCSGGIFGIGESDEQRVELAMTLRELDVDSVPINILHPIEGTKIYGKVEKPRPQDILKLVAMFRFVMPNKIIGVFGGRELSLGDWQPKIFEAGANGILLGNYLTTTGNPAEVDLKMIQAAGLVPMAVR